MFPKKHTCTLNGFWNQQPQILCTWTLWDRYNPCTTGVRASNLRVLHTLHEGGGVLSSDHKYAYPKLFSGIYFLGFWAPITVPVSAKVLLHPQGLLNSLGSQACLPHGQPACCGVVQGLSAWLRHVGKTSACC